MQKDSFIIGAFYFVFKTQTYLDMKKLHSVTPAWTLINAQLAVARKIG